jgi:Tfp pilus assembly protein FimT
MQPLQRQQRSKGRHRKGAPLNRCARAFSIFELIIVLLIMSILTAVAAPAFYDSLLFHRVESAARRVKADLELAQTQARLTSTAQTVAFTNSASSYTLSNTKSLDKPNLAYTVDLTKQPYTLNSAAANFSGAQTISFNGYGTPSSSGTVVLTAKSHQCTVTVNGTTGGVTIISSHSGGRTPAVPGS